MNMKKGSYVLFTKDGTARFGKIVNIQKNDRYEIVDENFAFNYCTEDQVQPAKLMDIEEALETLDKYSGHHCDKSDEYQFNIKMHHIIKVPDEVEKLCTEEDIYNTQSQVTEDQLRCFMGGYDCEQMLDYCFDWINGEYETKDWQGKRQFNWWQRGRSGGWLIIKDQDYSDITESYNGYLDDLDYWKDQKNKWEHSPEECAYDIKQIEEELRGIDENLEEEKMKIILRAEDLEMINLLINHSKDQLAEYLGTVEAYENIYQPALEEQAEEEWIKEHTLSDYHKERVSAESLIDELEEIIQMLRYELEEEEPKYVYDTTIKIIERRNRN